MNQKIARTLMMLTTGAVVFVIGMSIGTIRAHRQCREISYRQFVVDVREAMKAGKPFWLAESNIRAIPVLDHIIVLNRKQKGRAGK
jgi:hypothetical protein